MAEVYVHLREGLIHRSETLGLDIVIDYDTQGLILGVEILGAEDVTIDGSLALPTLQHHPRHRTGAPSMIELVDLVKKRAAEIEALEPEQAAREAQELWESLLDCADVVTPLRAKCFRALKKATGWSYPKIAEMTGATVTTVGSFFRGRQIRKKDSSKSLPLRRRSVKEKKIREARVAAKVA